MAYDNCSSVKGWVEESVNEDTILFSDSTSVRKASQLLLAYAVDPLGIGSQWTVAYGLPYSLELNYSKLGGGNQFGLRWQALKGRSNFTIGASYASQDYELPSLVGKAQSLLGYTFERKDIAIPLVWGKTGGNPKKAHYEWGVGLQLQKSTFQYGFSDDSKLMVATWLVDNALDSAGSGDALFQAVPQAEVSSWSIGGMSNARFGYSWVNVALGIGVYYNDYGEFTLLDQSVYPPTGISSLPRVGLEIKAPLR